MKTFTIKRMLIVIAALFTISQSANAQNYIREVDLPANVNTIVRVINEKKRVVYVDNTKKNERVFLYYRDTLNTPYLFLVGIQLAQFKDCEYYVNDFVVYKEIIYFCGHKIDVTTGDSTGVFGYIDPANLNNVTYCDVPGTIRMRKIQVFEDAESPHVVMVGDENSKTSTLAEALVNAPNIWKIVTSTDSKVENNRYDDLTVTDSHVVAVSRNRVGTHSAYVHLFNRPNTYVPILLTTAKYFGTDYNAHSPIMVEHRAGKEFVTVTNTASREGYYYSVYSGESHIASSKYMFTIHGCTLYDIRYNRLTKKTDVLTRNTRQGSTQYEIIHHFTSGMSAITSHVNHENAIQSLDYIENTGNMVASGFSLTNDNLLLYKYQPEVYTCFTMRLPVGEIVSNPYEPEKEYFDGIYYTQSAVTVEPPLVIYRNSILCE